MGFLMRLIQWRGESVYNAEERQIAGVLFLNSRR